MTQPDGRSATRLLLAAAFAAPTLALAHTGVDAGAHHGVVDSLMRGFTHPMFGIDHLAAMLAVGLWSALSARRPWPDLLWAPLAFAGMLLLGAIAGTAGATLPGIEPMIAASLFVIGLLACTRARLPGWAAALLVGGFALFHGIAHGNELAGVDGATAALTGMVLATALLHGVGITIGWVLRQRHALWPRAAGAAIAALGAGLLVQLA